MDYTIGNYYPTATDGLRNMTGVVNGDGTVTLYAVTSTVSMSGDQGADPNEIVAITDTLGDTALPMNESFSVIDQPQDGAVLAGSRLTRCLNRRRSFGSGQHLPDWPGCDGASMDWQRRSDPVSAA